MTVHYDGKGKFYTDFITKDTILATIQTASQRIHGNVHVRPEERLIDELNGASHFVAVTEATVWNAQGARLYQSDFLAINREYIVWLIPDDDLTFEEAGDES